MLDMMETINYLQRFGRFLRRGGRLLDKVVVCWSSGEAKVGSGAFNSFVRVSLENVLVWLVRYSALIGQFTHSSVQQQYVAAGYDISILDVIVDGVPNVIYSYCNIVAPDTSSSTSQGGWMSRALASHSGRSGNPKVAGSNPDLTVFEPWSSQTLKLIFVAP